MFTVISILLVIFFLLMNAFFVIAEFALVRVRKSQIELAVEEKKPGARAAYSKSRFLRWVCTRARSIPFASASASLS